MREIEFRIRYRDKTWYYGLPISKIKNDTVAFNAFDNSYYDLFADATSLGQYTGLCDKNGTKIFEGDFIKFNNQIFKVVYEQGVFGLGCIDIIDYNKLEKDIENKTNNSYLGCYNDNFISLFEITWNFNVYIDDDFDCIEVIGNIHDNPELLGGSDE